MLLHILYIYGVYNLDSEIKSIDQSIDQSINRSIQEWGSAESCQRKETEVQAIPAIQMWWRQRWFQRGEPESKEGSSQSKGKCVLYSPFTFHHHLLVQGRPVFLSSSIFDLVPCLPSVGTSSCLPLRCPSISFSVGLCSFSQTPPVSTISHRCGCVLASSSGQTTLVFCFLGTFQQVLRVLPSWCLHSWCGPTWSSLLPISTSSFRLNWVCSHLSSLQPNILSRTSLLVWWLFCRLCLSTPRASSYRTSLRILPSTSSTRYVFYCWHQPVNLPHLWTVTRGIWRMSLWAVQHQQSLLLCLYHLWGSASITSLFCWSSAHASQTQLSMFPGLPPLHHES